MCGHIWKQCRYCEQIYYKVRLSRSYVKLSAGRIPDEKNQFLAVRVVCNLSRTRDNVTRDVMFEICPPGCVKIISFVCCAWGDQHFFFYTVCVKIRRELNWDSTYVILSYTTCKKTKDLLMYRTECLNKFGEVEWPMVLLGVFQVFCIL